MAGKTGSGTSWVPSQGDTLIEAVKTVSNALTEKYEEVQAIFKQIRGEEVIGESTTKDQLLEVLDNVDKTFATLNEKLVNVKTTLDEVFEVVNAAGQTNIKSTSEAADAVGAAAKKAENANGSGDN